MQTLNQIQILGNVGAKAKVVNFPNGGCKTILSIATNIGYGENKKTQWHTVLLYNKSAEICSDLDKGDVLWCSGYMDYRRWTDDSGIARLSPEIHVDKFLIVQGTAVKPSEKFESEFKGGSYARDNSEEQSKQKPSLSTTPAKAESPEISKSKPLPY